jgi:uncharacterized protein DUF6603
MAEGKSHSTKDLFLLMVGLYKLKEPPPRQEATSAEKYWLKDEGPDKGSLRELEWNPLWLYSPMIAWERVRYRDWLIAKIAANAAGDKQDFIAISEPLLASLDLLTKEFKPGMPKASDAIKQIVVNTKSGYERSFMSTLTLGLSEQQSRGKKVYVFGAGMRRRTCVWRSGVETEPLQADIEFFVPFYVIPQSGKLADLDSRPLIHDAPGSDLLKDDSYPGARSICGGIALTRVGGNLLGQDAKIKDLAAVRFNFRIPFTAQFREPEGDLVTTFEPSVIEVQKKDWLPDSAKQSDWEKLDDWKGFVQKFCGSKDGAELLDTPIGPFLLETVSDESSIKDLILKKSRRDAIKKDLAEVEKELDETVELFKGMLEWKVPGEKPETEDATSSGERTLGGLLESLNLLDEKDGKYTPKNLAGLTAWDVVNRLFDELDGFPLYIAGVDAKSDKGTRIVISLASQADEIDPGKHYYGLAGMAYNIPIKTEETAVGDGDHNAATIILDKENFTGDDSILVLDDEDEGEEEEEEEEKGVEEDQPTEESKKKSTLAIRLQLGKWFDGETLDDNWFRRLLPPVQITEKAGWKRRVPLPGFRVLPFKQIAATNNKDANYSLALRGDLLSLGLDLKGTTKDGLTFLKAKSGPLAYFGLGAVEARIALLISGKRVAFGLGVKLTNLRLSFGPKEKDDKEKEAGDDIIAGLQDLLADEWVAVPAPEKKDKPLRTRMSAKKKDKFSISVGYLSPLSEGSHGTLDIQLYDEKGNRGKMVWIPIERRAGPVYLKHVGIGLTGVENVELSKGLSERAQLSIALTGGLRWPAFELGFIGATLSFPLKRPGDLTFSLDGLDLSFRAGPAVISGSFLKSGVEYAGSLTIDLPKLSIGAMGFYGNLRVFDRPYDDDIVKDLRYNRVHQTFLSELKKNKIEPAAKNAISRSYSDGRWKLTAADGKSYIITDDDGQLNVLSTDKTMFIYFVFSAASGGGFRIGPVEFTAFAFGIGVNRRVKVPPIEKVAEFPLVKMVMGEGGYQEEDTSLDIRNQLGKAVEDPSTVFEKMAGAFPAERGQKFICGGVRFTIATTVDCFALVIVQWGNEFEFSLLGLARFRQPRDLTAKAICYVELQILMTIKPGEGSFKLQALLTNNSWVINQDCKLTGGFALYAWFDGKYKDDFVITLGGYHPRFRRPDHYPIVPRLGLNWPVNNNLSIKGGIYFAITPSCLMLGAKLEATFQSGRISAWFTAYLDVIINWSPLHFVAEMGITLRIEAAFFLDSIKATLSVTLQMWGPPVGGIAHIDLTLIAFDIPFGTPREQAKPKLIKSWAEFSRSFLKASEADDLKVTKPVAAIPMTQPNLAAGRNSFNDLSRAGRERAEATRDNTVWEVRGDQLELAASAAVPVTTLNVGRVKINSLTEGVQERSLTGKSLLVMKPVELDTNDLYTKKHVGALGVHPMGKTLESVLNVTIVRDLDGSKTKPVDLKKWIIEAETGSLPAALWDAAKPEPNGPSEPTAKLIPNCITGIKRLRPPDGERGTGAKLSDMIWHEVKLDPVARSGASQEIPSQGSYRNIQAAVSGKQAEQKRVVDALSAAGFNLAWQPAKSFRELQAKPLVGAVAKFA